MFLTRTDVLLRLDLWPVPMVLCSGFEIKQHHCAQSLGSLKDADILSSHRDRGHPTDLSLPFLLDKLDTWSLNEQRKARDE